MLKQWIKILLSRYSPSIAATLISIRSRRMQERQARDLGLVQIAKRIAHVQGLVCAAGPFAGMRFPPEVLTRHSSPKLLGTYEHELHDLISNVLRNPYKRIINIGCSEGYYAVGFALRIPNATVFAFDTDPVARRMTRKLARLNECAGRVCVRGFVRPATLEQLLESPERSLVFMDCEGCEVVLLDLQECPNLRNTDVVAELHPDIIKNLEDVLWQRFKDTHEVVVLRSRPRERRELPLVRGLKQDELLSAIDERRPQDSKWMAFLRPCASQQRNAVSAST